MAQTPREKFSGRPPPTRAAAGARQGEEGGRGRFAPCPLWRPPRPRRDLPGAARPRDPLPTHTRRAAPRDSPRSPFPPGGVGRAAAPLSVGYPPQAGEGPTTRLPAPLPGHPGRASAPPPAALRPSARPSPRDGVGAPAAAKRSPPARPATALTAAARGGDPTADGVRAAEVTERRRPHATAAPLRCPRTLRSAPGGAGDTTAHAPRAAARAGRQGPRAAGRPWGGASPRATEGLFGRPPLRPLPFSCAVRSAEALFQAGWGTGAGPLRRRGVTPPAAPLRDLPSAVARGARQTPLTVGKARAAAVASPLPGRNSPQGVSSPKVYIGLSA